MTYLFEKQAIKDMNLFWAIIPFQNQIARVQKWRGELD